MQLKNLKPAWKQMKLGHNLAYVDTDEILAIIDKSENHNTIKAKRVVLNVVMIVVITIICQGG